MNQKVQLKETCQQIVDLFMENAPDNQNGMQAFELINKLRFLIDAEKFTNDKLIPILETTKEIASTKKNFKQILEKELLSLLSYLPHKLWRNDKEEENQLKFERNTTSVEGQIAESLINFAKEIYELKLDRDAFAGKRRGYAIEILESLSDYFAVPEFMKLCTKSISSKSKNEFLVSVECLKNYCEARKEVPNEDLIAIVDKRIAKTKHRIEATAGLILQVNTGLISEFEALSRLDDWKEKNDWW